MVGPREPDFRRAAARAVLADEELRRGEEARFRAALELDLGPGDPVEAVPDQDVALAPDLVGRGSRSAANPRAPFPGACAIRPCPKLRPTFPPSLRCGRRAGRSAPSSGGRAAAERPASASALPSTVVPWTAAPAGRCAGGTSRGAGFSAGSGSASAGSGAAVADCAAAECGASERDREDREERERDGRKAGNRHRHRGTWRLFRESRHSQTPMVKSCILVH